MTNEDLIKAVLAQDTKNRVRLTHRLIASLDEESGERLGQAEWESAWVEEAERRLADMREGKVTGIPGGQVFGRARARLNLSPRVAPRLFPPSA